MRRKVTKVLFVLIISVVLVRCSSLKINKEAEYSLLKGVNYSQQGEYDKAMKEYFYSYELNPENVILLKEIGYNYYQFGDFEKAEEYWLKALKINYNDEELLKNLATLYYQERRYSDSINIIGKSYNLKDSYYQKLKGLISYQEGNLKDSYSILKNISVSQFDLETALIYIEILEKLNKKEELVNFSRNIYPYLSNERSYIIKYSQILTDNFNLNRESEKVLLDYLLENGSDDEVLLQLANLYFKIGNEQKGKDTLKLISDDTILFKAKILRGN